MDYKTPNYGTMPKGLLRILAIKGLRPQAPFRVKPSMLENPKSAILIGKLRDGHRLTIKTSTLYSPNPLQGMKNLSLGGN